MITTAELLSKTSQATVSALDPSVIAEYLAAVPGWTLDNEQITIAYSFKNFYQTMAFVNAIAYVAHAEDHHPDLSVSYKQCTVSYSTHSVNQGKGGISENDFICAAKFNAIFQQRPA